jgi:hypothetical protein
MDVPTCSIVPTEGPAPKTDPRLDPTAQAIRLLQRSRLSALGALVAEALLVLLFLWGVNPGNLANALVVLAQSGLLVVSVAVAMLLPVLTVLWVGSLLQSIRAGDWTRVRRLLPGLTGLGYVSLIVPGFYLHETIHLLNSPAWPRPSSSPSPSPH